MDTRRASIKLEEARFFFDHLREEASRPSANPHWFRFYLSAFLNAAYGITKVVRA